MEIRELDPERDADDCVELLRATSPGAIPSRAAWIHRVRSLPERALLGNFVADEGGRVIGESYGFLGLFGDDATGVCQVTVAEDHRRRGIGSRLFERVEAHLAGAGVTTLVARFAENEPGLAFATRLGFHEARVEVESAVDLRSVD